MIQIQLLKIPYSLLTPIKTGCRYEFQLFLNVILRNLIFLFEVVLVSLIIINICLPQEFVRYSL